MNNYYKKSLENFKELAAFKNFKTKCPTKNQYLNFIDIFLLGKNSNDSSPSSRSLCFKPSSGRKNNKWVWVEIKNFKGDPGWLYGAADFIVFEFVDRYLFVPRKNLIDFVHSKINFSASIVANPWEAKYKIFQRENNFDEITQVNSLELLELPDVINWKKQ